MPVELNDPRLERCVMLFHQCLDLANRFADGQSQTLAALGNRAELQFTTLDSSLSALLGGRPLPTDVAATADELLTGIESIGQQLSQISQLSSLGAPEGLERAVASASASLGNW
jgi:hypothetical protein